MTGVWTEKCYGVKRNQNKAEWKKRKVTSRQGKQRAERWKDWAHRAAEAGNHVPFMKGVGGPPSSDLQLKPPCRPTARFLLSYSGLKLCTKKYILNMNRCWDKRRRGLRKGWSSVKQTAWPERRQMGERPIRRSPVTTERATKIWETKSDYQDEEEKQRNQGTGCKLVWEAWQWKHRTNRNGNFKRMRNHVKISPGSGRAVRDRGEREARGCEWSHRWYREGVRKLHESSRGKGERKGTVRRDPFILVNEYLFFHPFIRKGFAVIYRLKIILVKLKVGFFGSDKLNYKIYTEGQRVE